VSRDVLWAAGAGYALVVLGTLGTLAWWAARPGLGTSLAAGFAVSLSVVLPWSVAAALTIGPAGLPPPGASPLQLAGWLLAGPSGKPGELAAVCVCPAALLAAVAGWRTRPGRAWAKAVRAVSRAELAGPPPDGARNVRVIHPPSSSAGEGAWWPGG
jgi:hypothetical protein